MKAEEDPIGSDPLDKLFSNDLVAIDAARDGSAFFLVSRGANFVFRATLDGTGKLTLGSPPRRIATGNLPNGIVVSTDGTRAYVNNELNVSVTSIDLASNAVLDLNIPTGTPPAPGTFTHAIAVGKLAFFTALGVAENGLLAEPLREIDPHEFRGRQSNNAWSSCASCHPDGLTDNVAWIFTDGPRNTISLDAFFAKDNPGDQRISNWSAIRSSVTDFNNNSRNVQGGIGFSFVDGDPMVVNPNIFNHCISQGVSDALDLQTLWVQTIRTRATSRSRPAWTGPRRVRGQCASCHGGAKWTKSQTLYQNDPTFTGNPVAGGVLLQSCAAATTRASRTPARRIVRMRPDTGGAGEIVLQFLEPVGAFNAGGPIEIRSDGTAALGGLGFNVPSLLGSALGAPFLHDGSAATLDDVFTDHALGVGTIVSTIGASDRTALQAFLGTIDGRTAPLRSATDEFKDALTP